jgi:hypothetical protein
MIALLILNLQKEKFWIIVDPTHTILDGNTCNANTQIPKPGVDHHRNPAVYYCKALLCHWVYIWSPHQRYPDRDLLLHKDDIKDAFIHILYHPDIAPAFATVLLHILCIPGGLIFGATPPPLLLLQHLRM